MNTSTTTLTDRYIYAATRSVAEKSRADLSAELAASIADAIDARIEAGDSPDSAERTVLSDMGDPDRLAADYTDRPAYLIGPRYYFEWWRLVKILLAIVLPLAGFGVALGQLLSGAGFGEAIGSVVAAIMTIALHLVFWPTLIFALLERHRGPSPLETSAATAAGPWAPWTLERLPDIREKGLGTAELVTSLVAVALGAAAVLWDQLVGFVFVDGEGIPLINPALWSGWIPLLLIVLIGEALFAVVLYRTGRWTVPLAVANTVLALAFAVPIIWLSIQGLLFNPAFFEVTAGADAAEVASVVGIVVGCIAAALALWDTVDGWIKAARARR
jgi:hypothetical protein